MALIENPGQNEDKKDALDARFNREANIARINLNDAKVEEIQSTNRVNYLMQREQNMMRKIYKARELANRIESNIKNKRAKAQHFF